MFSVVHPAAQARQDYTILIAGHKMKEDFRSLSCPEDV